MRKLSLPSLFRATLLLFALATPIVASPCYQFFWDRIITYDNHRSQHTVGIIPNITFQIDAQNYVGDVYYNLCRDTVITTDDGKQEPSYAYFSTSQEPRKTFNMIHGQMGFDTYKLISDKRDETSYNGFKIESYRNGFVANFSCAENESLPTISGKEFRFSGRGGCGFVPQWSTLLMRLKTPLCILLIVYGFFEWLLGGIKRKSLEEYTVFLLSMWLWFSLLTAILQNKSAKAPDLALGMLLICFVLYFPTRLVLLRLKHFQAFVLGAAVAIFVTALLTAAFTPIFVSVSSTGSGNLLLRFRWHNLRSDLRTAQEADLHRSARHVWSHSPRLLRRLLLGSLRQSFDGR